MSRPRQHAASAVVVAAMLVGLWFVAREPARALRREHVTEQTRTALLEGLAHYHSRHGTYPAEPFLSGGELAALLVEAGCLDSLPLNPTTNQPFGTVDLEDDPFFYSTPDTADSFTLETL